MTRATALARLTRWLACAATIASFAAYAQPQPQDNDTDTDPPVRVARMSYTSGRVSFSPAGNDAWVEAQINRPVATGDRVWADADSRAELSIDNSTWWLGDSTSLAVSNLDDRIVQMQLQEGVVDVNVRTLPPDNIVEIDTPNLAFSLTRPGRYRVEVDPQDGSTLVTVRDGNGEVYGEGGSYVVNAGQAYRFYGTDVSDSEYVPLPPPDAFDRFAADRERQYTQSAALRYVSPEVIGYQDLDRNGSWSVEPTYGNVWFPRAVSVDWAPYREGHWAWIDPWGWTWVDSEPWGFAPFHYGRWAHFSRGWGWVPGPRHVRAVYAPALVAFIGGAGFGVAVSSGPAIGWFPLAPREVYVPPYRVSRNYFRQVNVTNTVVNVTNITNIYNNPTRATDIRYANRAAPNAVTAVPPAAFAQAQNVGRAAIAIPAAAVQRAEIRPVAAVAPARPAFLGASPTAQVRPPAATLQRQVVAKAPPPPPPVSDAQRIQALEKNPGRPLSRAEVQTLRRSAPPAAGSPSLAPAPAKVVTQAKPAPNAAPPAREAGTRRPAQAPGGAERRTGPGAPPQPAPGGPAVAQPPAPGAPSLRAPQGTQRNAPQEAPGRPATPPATSREAPARPPEAQPQPQRAPEARPALPTPNAARRPEPPRGPPAEAPRPPQQPQLRPAPQPQPEARPAPQPRPEAARKPEPPRGPPAEAPRPPQQPQLRPAPQPQPQARPAPQPQLRPAPQPQPEAARRPEPQRGPPPEAARPAPQPQLRPAPQPQPQARPAPQQPEAHRPPPQQPQRRPEKDEKGNNG